MIFEVIENRLVSVDLASQNRFTEAVFYGSAYSRKIAKTFIY